MSKKGFTLIELLAVVVILAIIALIATPIVLKIISDTRDSSRLRSAEFYFDAVEQSILRREMDNKKVATGTYYVMKDGNICLSYDEDNKCTDILEIKVDGEVPTEGRITIKDEEVGRSTIKINNKTIIKDSQGSLTYPICSLADDSIKTGSEIGAKYECKVDPDKETYTFYVVSNNDDGTTNLILEKNICEDGTFADNNQPCPVLWYGEELNHKYGPVTAITYLHKATKNWTNVEPLNYEYNDSEFQGGNVSYTSFISTDGIAEITGKFQNDKATIGTKEEPLRSRLPIYSQTPNGMYENELLSKNDAPYLYYYTTGNTHGLAKIRGYWSLSSTHHGAATYAWYVYPGGISNTNVNSAYNATQDNYIGVRPVIAVQI